MSIIDEQEEQLWFATWELLLLFNIGWVKFFMVSFVQTLKNASSLTSLWISFLQSNAEKVADKLAGLNERLNELLQELGELQDKVPQPGELETVQSQNNLSSIVDKIITDKTKIKEESFKR